MSFDEQFLIQQLKEGNEQAYHWLFSQHYAPLCMYVGRLLHDNALAESIVDDVIYHIWEIRDHIEITTSLRSYLMRSVRNRCTDHLLSLRTRSRAYGATILLKGRNAEDLHFNGEFNLRICSLTDVLEALAATNNLTYTVKGSTVEIR